jgi:DNA-binding transcriptional MocR family regulator
MSVLPAAGVVSLARGVPGPELLPLAELEQCAGEAIRRDGRVALNYGAPGGYAPLREHLAAIHGVEPRRVVLTPGSMIALNLLIDLLAGDRAVLAEEPTYDRALVALRRRGAFETVRRGPDGLDLHALDGHAQRTASTFYVLPTFHNPTGWTLTLDERRALVDLAVERGLLLVEDDPYGLLRFEGDPLPTLHELLRERDADELCVYVSSFSKSVAPGLRVGYVIVPDSLVERLERLALDTYVSPPLFPQAHLYEFIRQGLMEPHLARLRLALRERRDALVAGLKGAPVTTTHPEGGYFLWIELPTGVTAAAALEEAEREGVSFVPGTSFEVTSRARATARLSFSFPSPQEITAATARLATALARVSPD